MEIPKSVLVSYAKVVGLSADEIEEIGYEILDDVTLRGEEFSYIEIKDNRSEFTLKVPVLKSVKIVDYT